VAAGILLALTVPALSISGYITCRVFLWGDPDFTTAMHDALASLDLAALAWSPKSICLALSRALPSASAIAPLSASTYGGLASALVTIGTHS